MTAQTLYHWCFAGDGALPRYVMHVSVRVCTAAKQDDVDDFGQLS